jgi:mannitol-1-/sugar-/sorbitol-6-phosphatase
MRHSARRKTLKQISEIIDCVGVLFDMDGVLLDSTPAVARVWYQWALERGFDPDEVVRAAHGRPSISTIRDYLPGSDYETENREVERRELADLEGVVPWPGAVELLKSLPLDRWGIVTSCTRPLAEARLRAGGLPRPKCFVSSDDIRSGKPAPDPYLTGAKFLGLNPADCIVVEDVPAGVRSGRAAGCRVIALCTTMPERDLQEAGADWLVKDCSFISVLTSAERNEKVKLVLQTNSPRAAPNA